MEFYSLSFSQLHLGTGGYTHKQPETQQPK